MEAYVHRVTLRLDVALLQDATLEDVVQQAHVQTHHLIDATKEVPIVNR